MAKARRRFDIAEYDFYVKEFIRKSEENGTPISYNNLRLEPFNLPDSRWYIANCPDKTVDCWAKFVAWCGFYTHGAPLSKERATELIYKMQEQIGRPLMYDDFRGRGCYRVPIEYIRQTWGSINKMKEALGLEIVQESMIEKQLSKEDFDEIIYDIVDYVNRSDKDFITTKEIDANENWNDSSCLRKYAKKYYNQTLMELFESHNISCGQQGRGINFTFDDGEHITSQFEYMFSEFLKNYGLKYNVDYFRDVNYSQFIDDYTDKMNCDYVIHIDNKVIYVEIAGIIESYKEWFYNDRPISRSKSKERYRLKLKRKEQMLKNNGLLYFILFPCDLTQGNYRNILEDSSLELKKKIEAFNKNNIDWVKIRETGELKYTDEIKYGRNVIDYREAI